MINEYQSNGLDYVRLECEENGNRSECSICLFGCTVVSWVVNGTEMLWMSTLSPLDGSGPIRGGIPIAFPQFADNGELPLHGFARIRTWKRDDVQRDSVPASSEGKEKSSNSASTNKSNSVSAYFSLEQQAAENESWPYHYRLQLVVTLEPRQLLLKLTAINLDSRPWDFGTCFHPYFRTNNVRDTRIVGLNGLSFVDKVDQRKRKIETDDQIAIEKASMDSGSFVDRIYLRSVFAADIDQQFGTSYETIIRDKSRTIAVLQSQSYCDTVVFNPWIDGKRGPAHPDFDEDGFNYMVCVEPAVAIDKVPLEPGMSWEGSMTISVSM